MLKRLRAAVDRIALPKAMEVSENGRKMVREVLDIYRVRMNGLA
jgi:hypothetical protein